MTKNNPKILAHFLARKVFVQTLTRSKWQWFFISKDQIPQKLLKLFEWPQYVLLCGKVIEVSLLDEKSEMIALGNVVATPSSDCAPGVSSSAVALSTNRQKNMRSRISPYFSTYFAYGERYILPPKSGYFTVSVKVSKEDLPRVKSAKLEVKPVGE